MFRNQQMISPDKVKPGSEKADLNPDRESPAGTTESLSSEEGPADVARKINQRFACRLRNRLNRL